MGGPDKPNVSEPKQTGSRLRRRQEDRSAETQKRLIDAALEILRAEGYSKLTIKKVAQRAELSTGAMQHHFPSRDDLVIAMFDDLMPVMKIAFQSIATKRLPIQPRIESLIDQLASLYANPDYIDLWDIIFGTRSDEKVWVKVAEFQQNTTDHVVRGFVDLFVDIPVAAEDARRILAFILSTLRGAALLSLFGSNEPHGSSIAMLKETALAELLRIERKKTKR
ncbi:TetR/AcrR family transcriptional regulator [Sphingopyxis fribergensis]